MILAALASLLPNLLLNGWKAHLDATTSVHIEGEKTKRETTLATINGIVSMRQAQASVIQTGMAHKAFWIPWSIAAISASTWYAWGMLDSAIYAGAVLPDIAALPPQLLKLTEQVWENLFISGSIAAGGTAVAGSVGKIAAAMIGRSK